ncbi:DUF1697 domain-containing protein [Pontibacter sp. BT310]|uniref:DUF1697 domain-containing protein n=1 Tax=Pontibacter populi TaxID=890055 RepID=A0ABS6X8D3_9BACT|nr:MULTISPECIES: DUF1697 domain-containing protein [Pontibacter]MBJ6117385.1 DUF1697 domain-containing protein [Pontibacter sp. BT310]MBR0569810.1 DUF1697 domain-containing protein [Microvirga sp. STS03]MBW3364238.1 DUF1697 domain-containing protein [Pontibacter populi]
MSQKPNKNRYVALLRGINVGGKHKVPMAELKTVMAKLGFGQVETLLNSGNVIFDATPVPEKELETIIADSLEKAFGFPIPVLIRDAGVIADLLQNNPFREVEVTKDTRLYISFLKEEPATNVANAWATADGAFRVLGIRDRTICSVLDLALTQTTKGMDELELLYGKNMTTRNWNTIERIATKMATLPICPAT